MARFIILLSLVVFITSCKNIYESTADTDSADAKIFQMRRHIDAFEWDDAITVYSELSATDRALRIPRTLYVSALMGRCGFEFISFVNEISDNLETGAVRLFPLLLTAMPDATASKVADCVSANTEIQAIVSSLGATTNEYNMSVLNGLARIGIIVNDAAADSNNQPTAGFNPCSAASITDANMRQVVSGFARVISDISNSSLSFLGDSLNGLCDVGQPLQVAGVCAATDPATVTAPQICAMRSLLNESVEVGLGTNCTGDITACVCFPCP